jgi:hypothetical protein
MQVEDVMFIDEKNVVALEYIFYNRQGKYSKIKKVKEGQPINDQIGFEDYQKNKNKVNPKSVFNNPPIKFQDSKVDYINQHLLSDEVLRKQIMAKSQIGEIHANDGLKKIRESISTAIQDIKDHGHEHEHGHKACFLKTNVGTDAVVEPIISLWKINKDGQLYQINEQSFEYFQEFEPSKNHKMRL